MKLSDMLQKAENKLKNEDKELITVPWQTTSKYTETGNNVGTKYSETGNNVGTNVGTKYSETGNNVGTKYSETGNNVGTNVGTKYSETGNNVGTNVGTKYSETGNNVGTNVGTKYSETGNNVGTNVGTKYSETGNNVGTNVGHKMYYTIKNLTGVQLQLMHYMDANKFNHNKQFFVHINIKNILIKPDATVDVLKVSIQRINNKKIIIRELGVMGRNGFSIFKIPTENLKLFQKMHTQGNDLCSKSSPIYSNNTTTINKYKGESVQNLDTPENTNELIENLQKENESLKKLLLNSGASPAPANPTPATSESDNYSNQFGSNVGTNVGTKCAESDSNVVANVGAKCAESGNNVGTEPTQHNPEDWDNIDFSALAPFGFKKAHVTQIKNFGTSLIPQEVKDSIEHYAWALRNRRDEINGYAPENNPLRGLLGVLKKGNPWIEAAYKSTEDLAIEEQIKAKAEYAKRKKEQQERLVKAEFDAWHVDLGKEQLKEVEEKGEFQKSLPPSAFKAKCDSDRYLNALAKHFKHNIYKG